MTTRILLTRHGLSEGNVDPSLYIQKGDSNIGLATPDGWIQAFRAGQFLKDYYAETNTTEWPAVRVSSYVRPKETLAGIVHGMDGVFAGQPKLHEDPRLVEKFFGAASALNFPHEDFHPDVVATLLMMSAMVYKGDPLSASHLFGESTKGLQVAVKSYIDGTLRRDIEGGQNDFLFVTHGAVIQAFVMLWGHVPMSAKNIIGNPGNCDIIEILGESKKWKITQIWDGENFKRVNRNVLEGVKPYSFADLPPVPDFLRNMP